MTDILRATPQILLPPSTNFDGGSEGGPAAGEPEYLRQLRLTIDNRKFGPKTASKLLELAEQHEKSRAVQEKLWEAEAMYYSKQVGLQFEGVRQFLQQADNLVRGMSAQFSSKRKETNRLARECLEEYERNGGRTSLMHVNIEKLLSNIQTLLPSLKHMESSVTEAYEGNLVEQFSAALTHLQHEHSKRVDRFLRSNGAGAREYYDRVIRPSNHQSQRGYEQGSVQADERADNSDDREGAEKPPFVF